MTLAPRIEVLTQLSCSRLHGHDPQHNDTSASSFITTTASTFSQDDIAPLHFSIGLILNQHDARLSSNHTIVSGLGTTNDDDKEDEDPRGLPSNRCISDPAVQADTARLQTMITIIMGLLSALTTGWWGHFGERYGRTKVLAIATFGLFMTYVLATRLSV